jgi:hypothetical protein
LSSPASASSRKDVGALYLDHADLAVRQALPVSGSHTRKLHARQREADGARAAFAVIGVGGVHVGLGHAVALEDAVAGALFELYMGFGQQRRAAGDEQPHVADQIAGEAGIVEQPRVEGRHPHHRRCIREIAMIAWSAEAGQEDHLTRRRA